MMTTNGGTRIHLPENYEDIISHITPAFSDQRGDISNILSGVDFNHIALITSAVGSVRGNHHHPIGSQYIYVLEGAMISFSRPVESNGRSARRVNVTAGDLLYCPPMVAHAYRFLLPTTFLSITTVQRGDGEHYEDTQPNPVITQEGILVT